MPTISAFLKQALNSSLTMQLEAVTEGWFKYFPLIKGAYSHTGFNNGQATYFNRKVTLLFPETGHYIFKNTSCNITSVTT